MSEYIVGRFGNAIAAAVCEVGIMEITAAHSGWAFKQGDPRGLEPGLASASLEVEGVREERVLSHRTEDENRRRHVGVYALYDWCYGSDPQWLYQANDGNRLFSHDHGHYFPGGPGWTADGLQSALDDSHQWADPASDLDPNELNEMADRLANFSGEAVASILQTVPASWPATDEELEAMGHFLEHRAPRVAERLRSIITTP